MAAAHVSPMFSSTVPISIMTWRQVLLAASILSLVASSPATVTKPSPSDFDMEQNDVVRPPVFPLATSPFSVAMLHTTQPDVESADGSPGVPEDPSTDQAAFSSTTELNVENNTASANSPTESTQISTEGPADNPQTNRFRLHGEAMKWMDALRTCWAEGGRLAAPRSRQEAQALGQMLAGVNETNTNGTGAADSLDAVFVAANSLSYADDWRTADGSPLWTTGYAEWLSGRPRGSGRCGALVPDGRYVAQPCGARNFFACEDDAPASDLAATNATMTAGRYIRLGSFGYFRVGDAPARWADAATACAGEGATLALPRSAREAGALAAVLLQDGQRYFVGASDLAEEGKWRIGDGSTLEDVGYNSWAAGEPSGGRRKNCATLLADGLFVAERCTAALPYICRLRVPVATPADDGYSTVEGLGRYRLYTRGRTWFEAVTQCHSENATLAFPNSRKEAETLRGLLNGARDRLKDVQDFGYMHIGLHDIDRDGDWRTLDGETTHEAGYHNWWSSWQVYPQNNGDLCVVLENNRLSYFNYPCSNRYAFVCEKPW